MYAAENANKSNNESCNNSGVNSVENMNSSSCKRNYL